METKIIWNNGIPKRVPSTLKADIDKYPLIQFDNPVQWTDEMVSTLIDMRKRGLSITLCAERIGVAWNTCRKQIQRMGL